MATVWRDPLRDRGAESVGAESPVEVCDQELPNRVDRPHRLRFAET
jgi:hypothetical protein